jgi:hypothetical protein
LKWNYGALVAAVGQVEEALVARLEVLVGVVEAVLMLNICLKPVI